MRLLWRLSELRGERHAGMPGTAFGWPGEVAEGWQVPFPRGSPPAAPDKPVPTWGRLPQLPSGGPSIFCPRFCLLLLTSQPLISLFLFCSDCFCFRVPRAVSPRNAWAELCYSFFCEGICQDVRVESWHPHPCPSPPKLIHTIPPTHLKASLGPAYCEERLTSQREELSPSKIHEAFCP